MTATRIERMVGVGDLAAIANLPKQRIRKMASRPDWPPVVKQFAMGPSWDGPVCVALMRSRGYPCTPPWETDDETALANSDLPVPRPGPRPIDP